MSYVALVIGVLGGLGWLAVAVHNGEWLGTVTGVGMSLCALYAVTALLDLAESKIKKEMGEGDQNSNRQKRD